MSPIRPSVEELLGISLPVLAAPMAAGPTTPELVIAAAGANGLGFLAAGYKSADELAQQIEAVRSQTAAYGVNAFAPPPVPVDPAAYARYRELLMPHAERFGVELPKQPVENDDHWQDKIDLLVERSVPVVSFTFGIPDGSVLTALRQAGSVLVQTVTSRVEATQAAAAGVDALVVQASAAGAHSGTLTPDRLPAPTPLPELVADVAHAVGLPLIAAGGLADADDVTAVLRSGATAVMVGTALLLTPEAGTTETHRAALTDHARETVVTRAFTGRPARGLRNAFIDDFDAIAPAGYPAINYLTSPLRKAAAAQGDPEWVNLWAGTGYRSAQSAPVAQVLQSLAAKL